MMSKKMILIFVLLTAASAWAAVTIVRDKVHAGSYYVYIPASADANDGYYTKWHLRWPLQNPLAGGGKFPIGSVLFGQVYEGKFQDANEASTVSGTWTHNDEKDDGSQWNSTFTNYHHVRRSSTANNYLLYDIPDNHNRIHVMYYTATTAGQIGVSWSDGTTTGIDTTTISTQGSKNIAEAVIGDNTTLKGTSRVLKLNVNSGSNIIIGGVRSFNTSVIGDPSTNTGGVWTGHDLIDTKAAHSYSWNDNLSPIAEQSYEVFYSNTCELTISWSQEGKAAKWTGYGAHYGSADASFTPLANPNLYVDSNLIGEMSDFADTALTIGKGNCYTGDSIVTYVSGYGDYDVNSIQDANEPLFTITTSFENTGVTFLVRADWPDVNYTIATSGPYVPSILIPDSAAGKIRLLPDITDIVIGSEYSDKHGSSVVILYDDMDFIIQAYSLGPIDELKEYTSTPGDNKMYFQIQDSLLSTPQSDAVWTMGGGMSVYRKTDFSDYFDIVSGGGNINSLAGFKSGGKQ
jgi:hypothetical protein